MRFDIIRSSSRTATIFRQLSHAALAEGRAITIPLARRIIS